MIANTSGGNCVGGTSKQSVSQMLHSVQTEGELSLSPI